MISKPQKFEIKLKSFKEIAEHTRNLVFEIPKEFTFEPGQFLTFTLKTSDGETLTRSYSIASLLKNQELQFCIREVHEGSGAVFDLKKGDKISALGPLGRFILKQNKKDKFFITVGTGIAPFRSMVPEALKKNKVTLLAGHKTEKNALYHYEWKVMEKNNKNFKYLEVISRPEKKKTENIGRVQSVLKRLFKENKKEMKEKDYYLCGMGPMVQDVRKLLEEKGVPEEQINFERYS